MLISQVLSMAFRLFEGTSHVSKYSLYRPGYPDDMINYVIEYAKEKVPTLQLAVDVGCGSGQGTLQFAQYVTKMIATDISEEQIKKAHKENSEQLPNTEFICSAGEVIPVADGTVDLITCCQAFHWFNEQKFYKEATRVLKPSGCIAILGYHLPVFKEPAANEALSDIYDGVLGPYWASRRRLVDNFYEDIEMPYSDVERKLFKLKIQRTVSGLANYITSWSAYEEFHKNHPDMLSVSDIKERFIRAVKSDENADATILSGYWPYFLIIGRKS